MDVALEYIALALLIVVLVFASFQMVSSTTGTLTSVVEEQLYTVAGRLMDKIILTPGYPANWGTNVSVSSEDLKDFGLALSGAKTPYVLDPDKVMRLANLSTLPNPLLINASRLADLLGVSGRYGFRLSIKPLIRVRTEPISWLGSYATKFLVRVTSYDGVGLPNANVTGMYTIVRVQPGADGGVELKTVYVRRNVTDSLGYTLLDFSGDVSSYVSNQGRDTSKWYFWFLILHVNWMGYVTVSGYSATQSAGTPVDAYIIGDYIFVSRDINVTNVPRTSGAVLAKDEVLQAVPIYQTLLEVSSVEWCREQSNPLCGVPASSVLPSARDKYLVGRIVGLEALASHVFVFAQYRGQPIVIVASRLPVVDVSYGSRNVEAANSVTLRRTATLYNYPYVIELTVWRWVEG